MSKHPFPLSLHFFAKSSPYPLSQIELSRLLWAPVTLSTYLYYSIINTLYYSYCGHILRPLHELYPFNLNQDTAESLAQDESSFKNWFKGRRRVIPLIQVLDNLHRVSQYFPPKITDLWESGNKAWSSPPKSWHFLEDLYYFKIPCKIVSSIIYCLLSK